MFSLKLLDEQNLMYGVDLKGEPSVMYCNHYFMFAAQTTLGLDVEQDWKINFQRRWSVQLDDRSLWGFME